MIANHRICFDKNSGNTNERETNHQELDLLLGKLGFLGLIADNRSMTVLNAEPRRSGKNWLGRSWLINNNSDRLLFPSPCLRWTVLSPSAMMLLRFSILAFSPQKALLELIERKNKRLLRIVYLFMTPTSGKRDCTTAVA